MIRSVLLRGGSCTAYLTNPRTQQRHEPSSPHSRGRSLYACGTIARDLVSARCRCLFTSTNSLPYDSCETETSPISSGHSKRPFCKRCWKAMKMCICRRFQGAPVQNRTKITILQTPKEKYHALGSCRIAMLGLGNINVVIAPEAEESIRREQRCLALQTGRRSCLNTAPFLSEVEALRISSLMSEVFRDTSSTIPSKHLNYRMEAVGFSAMDSLMRIQPNTDVDQGSDVHCTEHSRVQISTLNELKAIIPPGVALLYPSEKAVALCSSDVYKTDPAVCHLIVLDGTWSKARRMYFENPWLHELPHYKLLNPNPSLYKDVRKEPKPEYISTLESIVHALKLLEPDIIEGLDMLLAVFNSMLDDQRLFLRIKQDML